MFRIYLYFVTKILHLIMIIGVVGFLCGFLVSIILYRIIPDSFEMPLGDLKGITVDSEGNIYCCAQYYSRIQVYNTEGKFLHGIFINTGGMFWIRINSNDQLEVAISRGDKLIKFDKNGKLLYKRSKVPNYSEGFDKTSELYCYDTKRDISYQIEPILLPFRGFMSLFGSQVVKKDSSGKETVIIRTPFSKWLFMGPDPAFFFGIFGGISSFIVDKKFRNKILRWINILWKRAQKA